MCVREGWEVTTSGEHSIYEPRLSPLQRLYFETEDPELAAKFAWAIPDDRAIQILLAHSPLVEIGSGRGYWGRLVADRGGIMHCYDINPEAGGAEGGCKTAYPNWCSVVRGGPKV